MNIQSSHNMSLRTTFALAAKVSITLIAALLTFATPPAKAQTPGEIHIGGKVYGGGLKGKIGTENAVNTENASIVTIKGGDLSDVYGGGEMGDSKGKTNVILQGGTISGSVFGGARMADVDGQTHVNIDAANATNDLIVKNVFGGNDVSGNITGTALVESTYAAETDDPETGKKIYVTNLFGGGNGDYDYVAEGFVDEHDDPLPKPEIANVQIDLQSGCYFQIFGGGNAATVTESTTISLNNSTQTLVDGAGNALEYQFERVFGGNNKAPMAIRPTWDLHMASVRDLYSGGNAGSMTYFKEAPDQNSNSTGGILIAIESDLMTVKNVYGGCRMADVNPGEFDGDTHYSIGSETFLGQKFQTGYAARVLIKGGNITNVYGGNDISGNVYYGSQVEILSSINGDVYGAGNGSYAYTDQTSWIEAHPEDADYYYDPTKAATSVEALNNWRPNVEKSWVHVAGKGVGEPTVIGGSLYCGGNSATLRTTSGDLAGAKAHLQIGSDVIADKVFQGSNGFNMISTAMLQKYADPAFSSLDLTSTAKSFNGGTATEFDKYMEGVEVAIQPEVKFDEDYADHSARFGSLYCGGNVGSMSADGLFTINFLNSLLIYDKLVAGSNSANVQKTEYNAFHLGGLIGEPDANGDKVKLNISGLKLEPRVLRGSINEGFTLNEWHYVDPDADEKMLAGANIYGGCYDSGYIRGNVEINITENAISDMVASSGVQYETIQNDVLASTLSVYGGGYGPETEIWGTTTINIKDNGQIMKAYGGGEQGVVGKLKRDAEGNFLTENVQEWYSVTENQELHGYTTPVTNYLSRDHSVAQFTETFNATVNLEAELLAGNVLNVGKLYGGGFQGTVSGNTIVNLNRGRVYDAFGGASNADILGHTEMYVGKTSAPTVTHNVYGANDFGGLIVGKGIFYVDNNKDGDHEDTMEKILSQTYVEYSSGNIAGDLFGGPCGDYEYTDGKYNSVIEYYTLAEYNDVNGTSLNAEAFNKLHASLKQKPGFCRPQLLENLLSDPMLIPDPEGIREHVGYAANSFVNIISQSTLSTDRIGGSIFGAGQGTEGRIKSADERGSYVRLMSATKTQRTTAGVLASRVYGAGFCSNTNRSLVDAYTGYYDKIFGGAHGITYQKVLDLIDEDGFYETNYMGYRAAVRLHEMANNQMDIYGGGANAGAEETGVVLNGGQAHNVYGGSYAQGITYAASVEIPVESTSKVNAIFGGAEGESDVFPCDVYNTFVTWKSSNARVQDAIYGGNNNCRMTRNAYLAINAPVRDFEDKLTNVFGGGYGPETVTLYTSVGLQSGAQVANVYGGGNNGQVLDTPSFRYYLDDGNKSLDPDNPSGETKKDYDLASCKTYPAELLGTNIYGYQKYLNDSEVIGFHNWIVQHCWDGVTKDDRNQPLGSYTANAHGHAHPVYFLSTQQPDMKNTNVFILKGATVAENAYGGGLGAQALVSGETAVHLWGGTVQGDIYGGGQRAHVEEYPHLIFPAGGQRELTMSSTHVNLQGGIARNVYGGGLNGRVTGSTNVVLGQEDIQENNFYGVNLDPALLYEHQNYAGDPIVERSLYGGGQMGPVYGTAYLTMYQGHVGYKYDAEQETTPGVSNANCYVDNLDLNEEGDNFLDQNGNVFGAGYGEGASVDVTYVNIYGGTIRNSLYGGGEIAAVGRVNRVNNKPVFRPNGTPEITVAGRTHIFMYKGLVRNDVFGGGRGFSYDLTGNEVIGKELYSDGYVFGTTNVEIRGGIIGTPETVEDGHGNVFGGGNIGYCYTDAQPHGERGDGGGEGRYYTNSWKCNECNFIDYEHDEPITCGGCHKSSNATDSYYLTSFTQLDKDGNTVSPKNENLEDILSEDCRVVVSPWAQVISNANLDIAGNNLVQHDGSILKDSTFVTGSYVPTAYLNLLKNKSADQRWQQVSDAGVIVRNAVFAGGNVSAGSDKVYANAVTVFGNATASINDVFFRDFITLGTEHIGGIYGDGNLTFVKGYRELNITNFGTDYYGQQDVIEYDEYKKMNDRERAYFELQYQATSTHTYTYYSCNEAGLYGGTQYDRGQHITPTQYAALSESEKSHWTSGNRTYNPENENDRIKEREWLLMTEAEQQNWKQFGFCSIYAGRLLNSIQRADFCGVFGSRIVLQGAQDRVPEVVDYTQYTINRVGELSLNKKVYEGLNKEGMTEDAINHGNYFGMYNIVNYLGALTSDVSFDSPRRTNNTNSGYDPEEYFTLSEYNDYYGTNLSQKDFDDLSNGQKGKQTFYDWKTAHQSDRKRNNGICHNTVALAAGVYLEVVKEPTTTVSAEDRLDPYKKDWGYITGVVQLDLINVMTGLGGGYVYAKNEHGDRDGNPGVHQNLSIYNKSAVNNSAYTYDEGDRKLVETSGNFIHNVKQIVDDCYPAGGRYNDYEAAPAHYWYIRGEFYVYDQYISAFTGSSTAYQENINLPLTITAGANGRLDLIDIKQNLYAYWKDEAKTVAMGDNDAVVVNNITYGLNDVITWWDYMQLTDEQKNHFVPETYVATMDYCTENLFTDGGKGEPVTIIAKGEVVLPGDAKLSRTYYDPEDITTDKETGTKSMKAIDASMVFHVSNAVSHENGYVLGVRLDNPGAWNNWYSPITGGTAKIDQATYKPLGDNEKNNYYVGPTYYTNDSGVYGQHQYVLDDIVTQTAKTAYDLIPSADIEKLKQGGKNQAVVEVAYVAVTPAEYDNKSVQAGVGISASEYATLSAENKAKFAPAYTCLSTFEENADLGEYIYFGTLIPNTKFEALKAKLATDYKTEHKDATEAEVTKYVNQIMNDHFDKAYIVTTAGYYGGQHFAAGNNYRALDTWATLSSSDREHFNFRYDALDALLLSSYPGTGEASITPGDNNMNLYDGYYWNGSADANGVASTQHQVYGAKMPIDYTATYNGSESNTYLTPGKEYTREEYEALPNEKRHYSAFEVKAGDVDHEFFIVKESFIMGGTHYASGTVISQETFNSLGDRQSKILRYTPKESGTHYICREQYTIDGAHGGVSVTSLNNSTTYNDGDNVPVGTIISSTDYGNLVNYQIEGFTIHGISPTETSTFYVNRESNIFDLSKDRIVTVIYQYKYEESDESGLNVEEITERHVINIHITFKSGVPTIGKLQDPSMVLPGQTVGLKSPGVTPGAYEILGGGWEIFTNPEDAEKHTNGKTYINNSTPMYWYQDGYWVAYYAKTYLGKTYSNSVKFKVANYHDIADVMADTENHMYIDHPDVARNSKIYIDNSWTDEHPEATKSEIDMLYDLFDKSIEKPENLKDVTVLEQVTDNEGHPLYFQVENNAPKDDTDGAGNYLYTTTEPTPFAVTKPVTKQVQTINDHTRNLANLDFYLGDNVRTIKAGGWQPIGTVAGKGECFMGTLHGMGYTINGLQNSLFENLCGYVYNLGVTGSFTKSGVADNVSTGTIPDTGDNSDPLNIIPPTKVHGHVNSSWIYTTGTIEGSLGDPILPVVGKENELAKGVDGMHVLNCYFPVECGYNVASLIRDNPNMYATSAPLQEFNNGKVTYELNGFYLNKRYSDATVTKAQYDALVSNDKAEYLYWQQNSDGTLKSEPTTGYYLSGGSMHAYRGENLGYVERLFADGDFVYKYGTIPLETNERYSTAYNRYLPVWPDDYYFFGQQLTYGYDEVSRPYQPLPDHVRKTVSKDGSGKDNRLFTTDQNNIVYRIPAYYRSKEKSSAHFNPYAVFADSIKGGFTLNANDVARGLTLDVLDGRSIHTGLTALDFSGFNDRAIMNSATKKFESIPNTLAFSYGMRKPVGKPGWDAEKYEVINDNVYFGPITDYTTLMTFETHGITQNLLAYSPTVYWSTGTANTQKVLHDYFNEPVYAEHYTDDKYRKVGVLDPSTISGVHGHLIFKENKTSDRHYYFAVSDQFLVDKQDFNAPIEYEFNSASTVDNEEYRMWYQRTPEQYAGVDNEGNAIGWEGISIPFAAELVSTQQKGEITHFYEKNGGGYHPGYNSGHEYWLREFKGTIPTNDPEVLTANMKYPAESASNKEVTNTFLWDYYYNANGKDANGDDYRYNQNNEDASSIPSRLYYSGSRTYVNYPTSEIGKPYIVGFPGSRYYEFDLSGTFEPLNSGGVLGGAVPSRLQAQTISFVSNTGITIHVSDDEEVAQTVTHNGYEFVPTYLNLVAPASVGADNFYVLNGEGSEFEKTTASTEIKAFRPYFATAATAKLKAPARSIVFGMANGTQFEPDQTTADQALSGLDIKVKGGNIVVESGLTHEIGVRIVTVEGFHLATFTIAPGERVNTPTVGPGVYIVNSTKVIVK